MNTSFLENLKTAYMKMADQLESAKRHCMSSANHFGEGEVPAGCAHIFAARGHLLEVLQFIDEHAKTHAEKSVP